MKDLGTLLVLPSLLGARHPDGRVRLTQKLIDGLQAFVARWPGSVKAILEPDVRTHSGNLDDRVVQSHELPFQVDILSFQSSALLRHVAESSIVLGGADHRLNHLPAFCRSVEVPYVFVSEYTLRTRWQIIDSETSGVFRRLRQKLWALNQELNNRHAAKLSTAVQCNGTPTYDAYRDLNPDAILYFDSRIDDGMLPHAPAVGSRIRQLSVGGTIHLCFSGRLTAMKGAQYLPDLADKLRNKGVPFKLSICGDGPLSIEIQRRIEALELTKTVKLLGSLDFRSELVPFVREEVDLFVCPHIQGDPSCTYIETMACGVPIVGFANEAFLGISRYAGAGWSVPVGNVNALADKIAAIWQSPGDLLNAATASLCFARDRTFTIEFDRRVDQLLRHARRRSGPVSPPVT